MQSKQQPVSTSLVSSRMMGAFGSSPRTAAAQQLIDSLSLRQRELFARNNVPEWVVKKLCTQWSAYHYDKTQKGGTGGDEEPQQRAVQAVEYFMGLRLVPEDSITPMALKIFEALDYNCSGHISCEEFVLSTWNIGVAGVDELCRSVGRSCGGRWLAGCCWSFASACHAIDGGTQCAAE